MPSKELESILQMLKSAPEEQELSFEEYRAQMKKMTSFQTLAAGTLLEPFTLESIPSEWVIPEGCRQESILLFLHGGGYCLGSIDTHRGLVSQIAKQAVCRGLLIDYRLGPENPFPAAVEDAVAAYRWLLSRGTPSKKIAVAGDSAGGGLTAALLLALKKEQIPMPACAICLSPWADLAMTGASILSKAREDPMITKAGLIRMADAYLNKEDPNSPLASPIHGDFFGMPPMLIQVGTAEVLLDDAVRLADQAKKAGVQVLLEPWEAMFHVWQAFYDMLPEAKQAIETIGRFILKHT